MNAQEQTLLTTLLRNLDQAAVALAPQAKDAEADRLIHQALAQRPDIAYLLVQRHLLLEQALQSAQARIGELERNAPASSAGGSFLGSSSTGATNVYGQAISPAAAQPTAQPTAVPAVAAASAGRGVGGGSFLGTAAATATGVIGGALLFQGIEHLMGGGQGFMGGNGWAGATEPTEVTNITENFYGTEPNGAGMGTADAGWSNSLPNDGFDDPAADPANPKYASLDDDGFDPGFGGSAADDSGGGPFDGFLGDGFFGGGDDDGWV